VALSSATPGAWQGHPKAPTAPRLNELRRRLGCLRTAARDPAAQQNHPAAQPQKPWVTRDQGEATQTPKKLNNKQTNQSSSHKKGDLDEKLLVATSLHTQTERKEVCPRKQATISISHSDVTFPGPGDFSLPFLSWSSPGNDPRSHSAFPAVIGAHSGCCRSELS